MKRKVRLSNYSVILSGSILIILLVVLYCSDNAWSIGTMSAILIVWCALALIYMPMSISVDNKELNVNRSLWIKRIPLAEISSIESVQPSGCRMCGSAGWFGYWGWFRDSSLGKYFAFYGNTSDCFFVRLKNGKQYMLGCDDHEAIVSFVSDRIAM